MESFSFKGPWSELECLVHPCKQSSAVLIMSHGFRGSREAGGRAAPLAEALSALLTVVRFNFEGSQILSHQVAELQTVLHQVCQRYHPQQVFLLGRSLGGVTSIIVADQEPLEGLILLSTPHALRAIFRQLLGENQYCLLDKGRVLTLEDERGALALEPAFLTDFDHYDLGQMFGRSSCPLLLHGEADEVVRVEQAWRNFVSASGPKELHIFPGADHSLSSCTLEVQEIICRWIRNNFSSGK